MSSDGEQLNVFDKILQDGDDVGFEPPPPKRPTRAYPGTEMKKAVLRARVLCGYALWHDDDPVNYEGAGDVFPSAVSNLNRKKRGVRR